VGIRAWWFHLFFAGDVVVVGGGLRRYARSGLAGLIDKSSKPASCPHQMPPEVEARIVELRRANPGWGPRTLVFHLGREGFVPVPGRSSVYRALVRHQLIDAKPRRKRRSDYKRWERSRAMELWQLDVMGRVRLSDGTELSAVTGIDDHSRFCVIARLVRRATAKPVCDALADALRTHGVPEAILTDNGKVFTGRFGLAKSPVLFDRICHDNSIRHLLTAPRSPTTTGKIERLHKTMRGEFFNHRQFSTLEETQAAFDAWVHEYNHDRPHQSIGDRPPIDRFRLAQPAAQDEVVAVPAVEVVDDEMPAPPRITRRVGSNGQISFAGFGYLAGHWLAGEVVEVVSRDGVIELHHRGVLIATHARRHQPGKEPRAGLRQHAVKRRAKTPPGPSVLRLVDTTGSISFAGTGYRVGNPHRGRHVEVAIVDDHVQISLHGELLKTHPIRHDRTKEHGAYATPHGRRNPRPSVRQVPEPQRRTGTGS
jgi:transposase InsO family protein